MRFLLLVLMFGIAASVTSCRKQCGFTDLCAEPQIGIGDCITDTASLKQLLPGRWLWMQTKSEGWSVYTKNPCTEHFNYSLEFLAGGVVLVSENGAAPTSASYTLVYSISQQIFVTGASNFSHPELFAGAGFVRLCGNYLVIDDSPVDGPRHTFLRSN